ncbi:SIR2 family protein [Mycobacterium sp. C3-094]
MGINADELYSFIQGVFRRGLTIVVGSGASCHYGLPSMGALADHLQQTIRADAGSLCQQGVSQWQRISAELAAGKGLESALGDGNLAESLADQVTSTIADYVKQAEEAAISQILADETISAFGRLFTYVLRSNNVADVITTNYDRLLEVHAAKADVRVDSMFYGHTIGRLSESLSRDELLERQTVVGRSSKLSVRQRPHIRLSKPHGSLDWYSHNGTCIRSDLALRGTQQIIAPGGNKYRLGYEVPFDAQRQRANDAIDDAAALLFIGYGFNDEHLQTHLRMRFSEIPSVVISRNLTDSAREYMRLNSTAVSIEVGKTANACKMTQGTESLEIDLPLWNLDDFVKEVLAI